MLDCISIMAFHNRQPAVLTLLTNDLLDTCSV